MRLFLGVTQIVSWNRAMNARTLAKLNRCLLPARSCFPLTYSHRISFVFFNGYALQREFRFVAAYLRAWEGYTRVLAIYVERSIYTLFSSS